MEDDKKYPESEVKEDFFRNSPNMFMAVYAGPQYYDPAYNGGKMPGAYMSQVKNDEKYCPNCGLPAKKFAKFCEECGTKLTNDQNN